MAKKQKILKDRKLIEYYAKKVAKSYDKVDKDSMITGFNYGDSVVLIRVDFEKDVASVVTYDVMDVYNLYAKNKYSSCLEFVKDFIAKEGTWYNLTTTSNGAPLIESNIKDLDYNPDTVSQGFDDIGLFMYELNNFLHLNVETINEADIRAFNKEYFSKNKKEAQILSIIGLVLFIAGIIITSVFHSGGFIVISVVGFIIALISAIRYVYFNMQLKSLKRNKRK